MKIMAVMTNYANAKNHVRVIYQSLPQTQVMKKGCEAIFSGGGGGGGGVLPYISHIGMCRPKG